MHPSVTPAERLAGLQHVRKERTAIGTRSRPLLPKFLSPASISAPGNLQACLLCVPAENSEACFWPSPVFTDKCLGATRAWTGRKNCTSTTIAVPSMNLTISLPITPAQRLADVQQWRKERTAPCGVAKYSFAARGAERGKAINSQQVSTE
jgi:hypothetical protein